MPCRARFTDTHGSVAVANSGAFGKRRARQGVCDALGVYVAQRVVELNESASLLETTIFIGHVSTRRIEHVSNPSNGPEERLEM